MVSVCSRIVLRAARVLVMSPKNGYLRRGMCTAVSRGSSPLLMLPSSFGSGAMKAYNVEDEKAITVNKEAGVRAAETAVVGLASTSHGWVALFDWNSYDGDLFLWHPMLGSRRVKLPVLRSLPGTYFPSCNFKYERKEYVKKVIISCSPDDEEQECCAMMIYGDVGMACCRSCCDRDEWDDPTGGEMVNYPHGRDYLDIVYSRSRKLFFCITERYERNELEAWDLLSSSSSPARVDLLEYEDEDEDEENSKEGLKYLVIEDEESGQLLVVTRRVDIDPDTLRYKTTGFDVHRVVDRENGYKLRYLKPGSGSGSGSLGGLSIFVGNNHSVAVKSPHLKPNSIYFTDAKSYIYYPKFEDGLCCYDIGVFDYENTSFSPCYYNPPHTPISTIMPPPFWYFNPTQSY